MRNASYKLSWYMLKPPRSLLSPVRVIKLVQQVAIICIFFLSCLKMSCSNDTVELYHCESGKTLWAFFHTQMEFYQVSPAPMLSCTNANFKIFFGEKHISSEDAFASPTVPCIDATSTYQSVKSSTTVNLPLLQVMLLWRTWIESQPCATSMSSK